MTTTLASPLTEAQTAVETSAEPQSYHWTVDAFYRAYNAGVFEYPERLELIHGRIIEKMPQNPRHASLITQIAEQLRQRLPQGCVVREEKPIRISFDGEPEPDITVVRGNISDFYERHPTPEDVVLLIEVSDSTIPFDTGEKAMLYAQAGIPDYWVVLAGDGAVLVHSQPTEDGYQSVVRLNALQMISPLAAPEITLSVSELLGKSQS